MLSSTIDIIDSYARVICIVIDINRQKTAPTAFMVHGLPSAMSFYCRAGVLQYATGTRLKLASVNKVCQFMAWPLNEHRKIVRVYFAVS